jgi:TatA/E family protein of Tat protein translocase
MFGLTPAHLIIILVIALIVVGPGKLPEVGSAIGKSIREFQKAVGPVQDAMANPLAQPAQPAQAPVQYVPVYPAPVAQTPVQYQPVMGVVESAPVQPAPVQPTSVVYAQPDAGVTAPSSPKAD